MHIEFGCSRTGAEIMGAVTRSGLQRKRARMQQTGDVPFVDQDRSSGGQNVWCVPAVGRPRNTRGGMFTKSHLAADHAAQGATAPSRR